MTLVLGLLNGLQRLTCHHQWVRARWRDGSYGLRCASCMKAYPHTWDEILATPAPGTASPGAVVAIDARKLDPELESGLRAA